jgi:hypothetical protein
MDLKETGLKGVDWLYLTPYRDQWRGFVNTVMNFRVQKNAGNFLTS